MYRILLAFHFSLFTCFFATVSQAVPTNTTRAATEAFVTNRVAIGVASAVAQSGANAATLVAGKLDIADTNGWVVSAHKAWLTNGQSSVTLSNFTASGHFMVPNGMIHMFPGVGAFATAYRRFGYDNGTFLFYDYSEYPDLYLYKFVIDPRDSSITYGSGLSAERWLYPPEGRTNTVASKSWVSAYVATNPGSSGAGNVSSVFGRTGTVVAVSGDYTAAQVGAYPASNPSNLTTIADVRAMTHTNQLWGAAGTNATYRMSWDITNGTFRVEEILP